MEKARKTTKNKKASLITIKKDRGVQRTVTAILHLYWPAKTKIQRQLKTNI
jgi:hypothetical protein